MNAAVLHQLGLPPQCESFSDPGPANDGQVLIHIKAAALKQLDKLKASGRHYTSYPQLPVVVGTDGAGLLEDGTAAYVMGTSGLMAEKALVPRESIIPIPTALDLAVAAALPNALIGADAALHIRGRLQAGQTVLINGATGVSGKMAVQMAKYRGASKIIVTGRNQEILDSLRSLGADHIVSLRQDDNAVIEQLLALLNEYPVDLVIDYLWGKPMELITAAIRKAKPHPVRVVTVGEMAGESITLPSALLRSTQIELLGSGIGSIPVPVINKYLKEWLPTLFAETAAGKLQIDVHQVPLTEVASAWTGEDVPGKRTVIMI